MSIDKDSTGMPQVDVHKRTTKVNLGVIVGVVVFLALMIALAAAFWPDSR